MSAPHSFGPDCEECEGPCLSERARSDATSLLTELRECQAALSALLGGDPDLIARICGSTTLGNRLIHVRRAIADATKDKPLRLGLEEAQELGCFEPDAPTLGSKR